MQVGRVSIVVNVGLTKCCVNTGRGGGIHSNRQNQEDLTPCLGLLFFVMLEGLTLLFWLILVVGYWNDNTKRAFISHVEISTNSRAR